MAKGQVRGGVRNKEQVSELYRLLKSFFGGWWVVVVAEIKYSLYPHPFMRPREARRVRD